MSDRTPFDDLARHKLAERHHPFDPDAWAAMEQQLDGATPRRPPYWPWALGAIALLVGTCSWYVTQETGHAPEQRSTVHVDPSSTTVVEGSAHLPAHPDDPTTPSASMTTSAAADPVHAPLAELPVALDAPTDQVHTRSPAPGIQRAQGSAVSTSALEPTTPRSVMPKPPIADDVPPHAGSLVAPVITDPQAPLSVSEQDVAMTMDVDDPATAAPAMDASTPVIDHPLDPPLADGSSDTTAPTPSITAVDSTALTADTLPHLTAIDTVLTVVLADTNQSTAPDTSTWLPPSAPYLEAGIWAGMFHTRTHYSGVRAESWDATHRADQSAAFGASLMRMGTRFGMGLGLQYSTYAEGLQAGRLTDVHTELVHHHHLHGIDTTLTFSNGTVVIDGQVYHVTQTVDTTILVLITTTGEEAYNTERRAALERSNRTSYLEIPLLFDVHATTGRWYMGLRGGPMLGVLQGRRGMLPGTQGYTDLADEAFKELVLGWTGEAYIRYRITGGWCIGVGPAARGQLLNTMEGDALVRRSVALGGQFSVSCLLK